VNPGAEVGVVGAALDWPNPKEGAAAAGAGLPKPGDGLGALLVPPKLKLNPPAAGAAGAAAACGAAPKGLAAGEAAGVVPEPKPKEPD
jgi:hypothetical protein